MQWNEGRLSLAETTRPILTNEPIDESCIIPPVSTEHFPFGTCFLRTELMKYRTSEPRFQAKGLGK